MHTRIRTVISPLRENGVPVDRVELHLAMPVTRVHAHPLVRENLGRSALQRGPLVYCFEDVDNPDGAFQTLSLGNNGTLKTSFDSDLLGGGDVYSWYG